MSRAPRVYMAGKIGHTDWRHALVTTPLYKAAGHAVSALRHVELRYDRPLDRVVLNQEPLTIDGFEYCGPYFLGDDHGCFHGPTQHGLIDPGYADGHCQADPDFPQRLERQTVVRSCLHWISQADVVFCWLESLDAYGTLVELGYAAALDTPIYVATDGRVLQAHTERIDAAREEHEQTARPHEGFYLEEHERSPWSEWWFTRELSANFEHEWSVEEAWQGFAQWWARRPPFVPSSRRLWVVEAR